MKSDYRDSNIEDDSHKYGSAATEANNLSLHEQNISNDVEGIKVIRELISNDVGSLEEIRELILHEQQNIGKFFESIGNISYQQTIGGKRVNVLFESQLELEIVNLDLSCNKANDNGWVGEPFSTSKENISSKTLCKIILENNPQLPFVEGDIPYDVDLQGKNCEKQ